MFNKWFWVGCLLGALLSLFGPTITIHAETFEDGCTPQCVYHLPIWYQYKADERWAAAHPSHSVEIKNCRTIPDPFSKDAVIVVCDCEVCTKPDFKDWHYHGPDNTDDPPSVNHRKL